MESGKKSRCIETNAGRHVKAGGDSPAQVLGGDMIGSAPSARNIKQLLGVIGSIILFIGVFTPIISVPFLGNMNYFQNGRGDGTIVLALSLISLLLVLVKKYNGLWFVGLGSMAIMVFTFIKFQMQLSDIKAQMETELAGTPLRGLTTIAMRSVQLQWGWALLVVGAALVIASAAIKKESQQTGTRPLRELVLHWTRLSKTWKNTFIFCIFFISAIFILHFLPSSNALQVGKAAYIHEDYGAAFQNFLKAAQRGNAQAQFNVGAMYEQGQGVLQDDTEAVKWYRKAAEQGYARAQHSLGMMYKQGQGVPQDDAEAVKYYRKAAEQGFVQSQFSLGLMYDKGQGVLQDDTEAVKWYRKAAEQGYARAQYNLGVMYEQGQGVTQDYVLAHMWLNRAATNLQSNELMKATEERDFLEQYMTKEQISAAKQWAQEWKPQN